MKEFKIHYDPIEKISCRESLSYLVACGLIKLLSRPFNLGALFDTDRRKVTCKNCKRTKIYKM